MERAEREKQAAEDKARMHQEEIEIQSIAARGKESKEMAKARRELEEHSRKEALVREKAEKEKQAQEDKARRYEEELETKLLAARGKEERDLMKARKELEVGASFLSRYLRENRRGYKFVSSHVSCVDSHRYTFARLLLFRTSRRKRLLLRRRRSARDRQQMTMLAKRPRNWS